jgi:hypothetical protein
MATSIIFRITKLYKGYKKGGCHSNTFNLHNFSTSFFGLTTACTGSDHGFNSSLIGVTAMSTLQAPLARIILVLVAIEEGMLNFQKFQVTFHV